MDKYDLEPKEFYIIKKIELENGNLLYDLAPIKENNACPLCGGRGTKHGKPKKPRKVRDISQSFISVGLRIYPNRYMCKDCGHTFLPEFVSVDSNARMTNRMKDYIKNKSLTTPFKTLADECGLSDTTVKHCFEARIEELRHCHELYAPEVLGIDENHLNDDYLMGVFVDVQKRKLLELLPKRDKNTVKKFIKSLPDYDKNIKVVTIDMWKGYKFAVYETIPNAIVVIDKFHVVKEINSVLNKFRKDFSKNIADPDKKKKLYYSRYLMLKAKERLSKEQEQRRDKLFKEFPELERPYRIKEMLRGLYKQETREDAESWYETIKALVSEYEGADDFFTVFHTIDYWHTEIFNYFDHKYTNAITEGINKQINEIGDQGRGYTFKVLREKAIYRQYSKHPAKFVFPDDDDIINTD